MSERKACILVVDDEELIRRLLERTLVNAGYDVVTASGGLAALDRLSGGGIDLMLLDVMMPGVNGFETLKLVRQKYDLPVIMLTGKADLGTLHDAIDIGADDYVRKPFHKVELLARIAAKLRRSARAGTAAAPGRPMN